MSLSAYATELTRLECWERFKDRGDKGYEMRHSIGGGEGEQGIVLATHASKKVAVRCSSRRTRTSQQRSSRELEDGDGLVALDGWKLVQELVESLTAFEIVEQRLHRHARADEHRRAAENFRIAVYDFAEPLHVATPSFPDKYT